MEVGMKISMVQYENHGGLHESYGSNKNIELRLNGSATYNPIRCNAESYLFSYAGTGSWVFRNT